MLYLVILAVLALAAPPVYAHIRPVKTQKSAKRVLFSGIISFFSIIAVMAVVSITGSPALAAEAAPAAGAAASGGIAAGLAFVGAGIVTAGSCIGSGIAVSSAATAALGAISENEGLFGKSLIFVALAEAISLYGVLISILILNKI